MSQRPMTPQSEDPDPAGNSRARPMSHQQMFGSSGVLPAAVVATIEAAGRRTSDNKQRVGNDEVKYL